MTTKIEFYKDFATLHRSRINAFYDKAMSKDVFISDLLFVLVEGLSVSDAITASVKACEKFAVFLECDLYRAELIDVSYVNGDFFYYCEIQISDTDDEFELTFYLSTSSTEYTVKNEDIQSDLDVSEVWRKANQMLKYESTFGSLKRT